MIYNPFDIVHDIAVCATLALKMFCIVCWVVSVKNLWLRLTDLI